MDQVEFAIHTLVFELTEARWFYTKEQMTQLARLVCTSYADMDRLQAALRAADWREFEDGEWSPRRRIGPIDEPRFELWLEKLRAKLEPGPSRLYELVNDKTKLAATVSTGVDPESAKEIRRLVGEVPGANQSRVIRALIRLGLESLDT